MHPVIFMPGQKYKSKGKSLFFCFVFWQSRLLTSGTNNNELPSYIEQMFSLTLVHTPCLCCFELRQSRNIRSEVWMAMKLHRVGLCYGGSNDAAMISVWQTQDNLCSTQSHCLERSRFYRHILHWTLSCVCTPVPRSLRMQGNCQPNVCLNCLQRKSQTLLENAKDLELRSCVLSIPSLLTGFSCYCAFLHTDELKSSFPSVVTNKVNI